ncbi:hypothetical protein BCR42DRAFT_426409 [Absidia repens]|uniref:Uncharacterized protein n=1 Tax=Absidia repens TaxID=90262 RepID=A0A1X2I198_9FUNG|nr:hypothetical protein BCR42DRAFT_426409 [Absidia repens]
MWVGYEPPSQTTSTSSSSMLWAPDVLSSLDEDAIDKIRMGGHHRTNHRIDFSSSFFPRLYYDHERRFTG